MSGALLVTAFACSSSDVEIGPAPADGSAATDGATPTGDAATGDAATSDASPNGCVRVVAAADRARKIVVSHPFANSGDKATVFEVLDLAQDGTITKPATAVTFQMGTALDAPIVFTPDGDTGLVAQDDGSIGVFRLPSSGPPVVVNAALKGSFYAGSIVLAPDGSHGWVLDDNTAENGGGVYALTIACDGTATVGGLVVPGGGAHAMALLPTDPTKALLASKGAFSSAAGTDVHLIDLVANKEIASVTAFADGKSIASSVAIMPDGQNALVADDGAEAGSRIAVVHLGAATVTALGLLSTPFPSAVVASPFGNAAIALNGDATNQIHVLSYNATSATAPFAITGELAYAFKKPEIPTTASLIDRGTLKGTVIVGENLGVRRLVFGASGTVLDAQKLAYPDDGPFTDIVGVVGVQP